LIDILYRDHGIRLVSTNVGSMGGIMALRRRETHFAGIHLLDKMAATTSVIYKNTCRMSITCWSSGQAPSGTGGCSRKSAGHKGHR
jgi:molybdate-binding protein